MKKESIIKEEKETVERMIHLYCRKKEGNATLCADCLRVKEYAFKKIDRCQFKPMGQTCRTCTVHCYQKEMRERIREIMRYAGPRMILYHPIYTLKHFLKEVF